MIYNYSLCQDQRMGKVGSMITLEGNNSKLMTVQMRSIRVQLLPSPLIRAVGSERKNK